MSTAITMQTVVIVSSDDSYDENNIMLDTGIAQAAANSLGQDVLMSYQSFYNFTTPAAPIQKVALFLTFLVTPAFATSFAAGIPSLTTRLKVFMPNITTVVTWGSAATFG